MTEREILEYLNQCIPLEVKSANRGIGSFLTFDVGTEDFYAHIWVYMASWRMVRSGMVLLSSNDDEDCLYKEVLGGLKGKSLVKFCWSDDDAGGYIFDFGEAGALTVGNDPFYEDEDEDVFMIFVRDEEVISYSAKNGLLMEAQ